MAYLSKANGENKGLTTVTGGIKLGSVGEGAWGTEKEEHSDWKSKKKTKFVGGDVMNYFGFHSILQLIAIDVNIPV